MSKYLLGTDNGCTISKAAIFTLDGREIAVASRITETLTQKPGWSERDINKVWQGTAEAIKEVITNSGVAAKDIVCVAPTGHGNGLYLVDKQGKPVRNAIMSTDSRARSYIEQWQKEGVDKAIRPKTA